MQRLQFAGADFGFSIHNETAAESFFYYYHYQYYSFFFFAATASTEAGIFNYLGLLPYGFLVLLTTVASSTFPAVKVTNTNANAIDSLAPPASAAALAYAAALADNIFAVAAYKRLAAANSVIITTTTPAAAATNKAANATATDTFCISYLHPSYRCYSRAGGTVSH